MGVYRGFRNPKRGVLRAREADIHRWGRYARDRAAPPAVPGAGVRAITYSITNDKARCKFNTQEREKEEYGWREATLNSSWLPGKFLACWDQGCAALCSLVY